MEKPIRIKGVIKKILYPRPVTVDTDFMIAMMESNNIEVIIKGPMYGVREKDELLIEGQWVLDKKYGPQITVTGWEKPIPSTKEQAIALLSSNIIKGCGAKTAKIIVDALGDDAINIIMREGESCLTRIKNIGKKNAQKIAESLQDNFNIQNIIKHLSQYGVTTTMAIKLHQLYKGSAVPLVYENPYILTNLKMVGFDDADKIARKMGFEENSTFRCQAAVLHVLKGYEGHCYTEKAQVIQDSLKLLNKRSKTCVLTEDDIEKALYYLKKSYKIVVDDDRIYLRSYYEYETTAARRIAELVTTPCITVPRSRIARELARYQDQKRIFFNHKQQEAIYKFFENNVLILTGGPGTGKTAVIEAITHVYKQIFPEKELILCAPTGRASQNLYKKTGHRAMTVHKVLNWGIKDALKDENNPLEEDLTIDEWSMADIELASTTFRAIPKGGRVLVVGDPDQLPSVGPGAVLRDMINSGCIPHIHLDKPYRTKNSNIIDNIYRVKEGRMIRIDPGQRDFIFIERPDAESTHQTIISCVKRLLTKGYKPEEILVLSPIKKGTAGVEALNESIRSLVNPPQPAKKELVVGSKTFRVGDVIIQNEKNFTSRNLFNGNMGVVKDICPDPDDLESEDGLLCNFCGDEIFLSRGDITELDISTAYSITVHKAQGGQAKVVIMPVLTSHYVMLTRNILYTAISRAEEMVILVGQKKAIAMAIRNNTPNLRRTFLSERIKKNVMEIRHKAITAS